jgi:hypothetical protein
MVFAKGTTSILTAAPWTAMIIFLVAVMNNETGGQTVLTNKA